MTNKSRHLKTIRKHRKYVRQMCFKMGIPWLGLIHDLSKYSHAEMTIAKYADGTRSPHAIARDELGYSPSWLHHYHKNKHHWQYWLDMEDWPDKVIPIKMPYKYVIEMFCDFVGAGKAYSQDKWTEDTPWDYWMKACEGKRLMHEESEYLIKKLLWNLKEMKMEKFLNWYKDYKKYLIHLYDRGTLKSYEMSLPL